MLVGWHLVAMACNSKKHWFRKRENKFVRLIAGRSCRTYESVSKVVFRDRRLLTCLRIAAREVSDDWSTSIKLSYLWVVECTYQVDLISSRFNSKRLQLVFLSMHAYDCWISKDNKSTTHVTWSNIKCLN